MSHVLAAVADHLIKAEHILFITGAGISADSSLQTYRGIGGLYEGQTTEEGFKIEVALSGKMLKSNPEITWKYLWQIGNACQGVSCNRGHEVIAEIEQWKPNTWVMTQNVDDLHRVAGSKNIIELHGRGSQLHCVDCAFRTTASDFLGGYRTAIELPPRCPSCNGVIRPDVVLFGESLPQKAVQQLQQCLEGTGFDLVFTIGTSSLFPYIIEPVYIAKTLGITTVEINPSQTIVSEVVDYRLEGTATHMLDQVWNMVKSFIAI